MALETTFAVLGLTNQQRGEEWGELCAVYSNYYCDEGGRKEWRKGRRIIKRWNKGLGTQNEREWSNIMSKTMRERGREGEEKRKKERNRAYEPRSTLPVGSCRHCLLKFRQ